MQATRKARLESAIQEKLSTIIRREVKDPRVSALSITRVELAPDASHAIVYVSIFAPNATEAEYTKAVKDCIVGLQSASGFLRKQLGQAIEIRHIPGLSFKEDRGFENVNRVHELLRSISKEPKEEPNK